VNPTVKYVATLAHVREVSLLGTANLAFWKDRLEKQALRPVEKDRKAQLLIVAADSKFKGVRFRELSFSVLARWDDGQVRHDGAYLVQAFDSCRLFAFVERVLFSTPYYYGDAAVRASLPAAVRLIKDGQVVFSVEMRAAAAAPGTESVRTEQGGWEGPVFLPAKVRRRKGEGDWFHAKIGGQTRSCPFLGAGDVLTIKPAPGAEVLQALLESNFVVGQWAVRPDASHAKSKTYKRSELGERLSTGTVLH
jgi:hypothetical protein